MINMKHYTPKELLEKFNTLSDSEKVKILYKALDYNLGSKNHKIFTSMGYSYSNSYNEITYVK